MMPIFAVLQLAEAELDNWLVHTTECFAWKGTPRSHFENHFLLDPEKSCEDILVIKDAESKILSSLRIFSRQIFVDGKVVHVGGIGEVIIIFAFYRSCIRSSLTTGSRCAQKMHFEERDSVKSCLPKQLPECALKD